MTIDEEFEPVDNTIDAHSSDFVAMPDCDKESDRDVIGGDAASLREAAERRSDPQIKTTVREYADAGGKSAPPNESISLGRASRDYSEALAAEKLAAESETSKVLAARVDALRAEALNRDSGAAEFYGFELPETMVDQSKLDGNKSDSAAAGSEETNTPSAETGLAPEIEKALQHPQVRQAIEERIGEAESARQDYLVGLSAATQVAQIGLLGQFPELLNIAPDQLPAALEQMSRRDPDKFARIEALVATGQQLLAQQQREGLRQVELAQRNFENYARTEDARLETMLKGETLETRRAVAFEIAASARASGIEMSELMGLFNNEPLMRNAVFQRMMYDAGKYRLMMKARDAATARPLPPVQRPGTAQNRAERDHAELRTLSARLASSGNIKDAVALYNARKSSRR